MFMDRPQQPHQSRNRELMESPQQRNLSSAFDSFSFERRHVSPRNQPSYQPRRSPNLSNSSTPRNYEVSACEVPVETEVEAEAETSDPEPEAPASPRQRRKSITFDSSVKSFGGRQQSAIPRLGATKASSSLSINPFDGSNYSFERRGSTSSRRGSGFLTAAQKLLLTPALSESACSLTSASTACSEASDEASEVSAGGANDRNDREPRTKGENSYLMTRLPSGERHSPELYIPLVQGRHGSFSSTRSRRRTISERSLNTNGSFSCSSPASVFLSSFFAPVAPTPEPDGDAEGQEVGSYILGRQLGSGGFSVVKEAVTMEDNLEVSRAVKIVKKRVAGPGDSEEEIDRIQAEFDQEVAMWRYLSHANIMQLIAVIDTPEATYAFMPLCRDGNLFELLRQPANREGLSHARVTRYAGQLASALRYLHEDMRIVHGDVKLENCMLDLSNNREEGGNILLSDFGLAKYIATDSDSDSGSDHDAVRPRKSPQQHNNESFSLTGSLPYSAPELLSHSVSSSITPASDVYAFAVTIFTLYTGTLPFSHELAPKLAAMILEGKWDTERFRNCRGLRGEAKEEVDAVVEVIARALGRDSTKRGTMAELLEGSWLEGCGQE
jgi:hypothetical protein